MEKNKIALVTGGSRGLGKNMTLRLAEKGMNVILTYNSKAEEAQKVVEQIEHTGQQAAALQINTAELKSFDPFIDKVKELLTNKFQTDKLDYLVNNAGVGLYAPIGQVTEELFDQLLNIHFKGVFFFTQKILPILNDGGGIVNISTGTARFSVPGSATYSCMKGAIEVFTRYLAKELGAKGIRANVIAPGAMLTDFGGGHLGKSEESMKFVSSVTALGRAGQPDDIGGAVAFLCTDDAKWLTGQRIEVSGGMFV